MPQWLVRNPRTECRRKLSQACSELRLGMFSECAVTTHGACPNIYIPIADTRQSTCRPHSSSAMKMTRCSDAIPRHLFARDLSREIRLAVTAKQDSGERNALFAAGRQQQYPGVRGHLATIESDMH